MNIKISIKDCDCNPTVKNTREVSEVEHKKKSMLYAPPERDKKQPTNKKPTQVRPSQGPMNSEKYRQSERQMLDELKKNGRNKATLDMVQNSNNILQRQNEILAENQKTINQMVGSKDQRRSSGEQERAVDQMKKTLDRLEDEMNQMRKIRDDIKKTAQDFNRNLTDFKASRNTNQNNTQLPQMTQMNSNLKDLVQISKNQVEGLQNLEALKNLQNFNIETYTQSINSIKRQIAQYQRQSENIERQLKIRAAKLQRLEISPKFQEELYRPYQEHLNTKINNIDLHSIRQKVYDKLGAYDYGKFEYDVGEIMCEVKKQLGNFSLVCKEYEIRVPDIKLDMKQLKQIDTKTPSVLDEYKASRGIVFENKKQNSQKLANNTGNLVRQSRLKKTAALQQKLKSIHKKPDNLRNLPSKPVDNSTSVKLTRQSDKPRTVLENQKEREKKAIQERNQLSSKEKKKQDEDFDKYLENRAKQELELIYKQRNERLKRMQQELQETCKEPLTFIQLDLDKKEINKRAEKREEERQSPKKRQQKQKEQEYDEDYADQFEEDEEKKPYRVQEQDKRFVKKESSELREATRDILKEKLKNLLKDKGNTSSHKNIAQERQYRREDPDPNRQVQNMAEGFVNIINNSLNQINANLASVIEKRVTSTSHEKRRGSADRKEARRIQVPKLQQCRPPPVYNINISQAPSPLPQQPTIIYGNTFPQMPAYPQTQIKQPPKQKPQKIKIEEFNELKAADDSYSDFNISELDDEDT